MGRRKRHRQVDETKGGGRKRKLQITNLKSMKPKHVSNDEDSRSDHDALPRTKGVKKVHKRKREASISDTARHGRRRRRSENMLREKESIKQRIDDRKKARHEGGKRSVKYNSSSSSGISSSYSDCSNSSCYSSSDDSINDDSRSRIGSRKRLRVHNSGSPQMERDSTHKIRGKDQSKRIVRYESRELEAVGSHQLYQSGNKLKIRNDVGKHVNRQCFESSEGERTSGKHSKSGVSPSRTVQEETGQFRSRMSSFQEIQIIDSPFCSRIGIEQGMEHGKGDNDIIEEGTEQHNGALKAALLEKQLRQKALANFMKFLDSESGGAGLTLNMELEPTESGHASDCKKDVAQEERLEPEDQNPLRGDVKDDKRKQTLAIEEDRWPLAGVLGQEDTMNLEASKDIGMTNMVEINEFVDPGKPCISNCQAKASNGKEMSSTDTPIKHFQSMDPPIDVCTVEEGKSLEMHAPAPKNTIEVAATTDVNGNPKVERGPHGLFKDLDGQSSSVKESQQILMQGKPSGGQGENASMFQKKTMSVMRGGELVQVNYKVYIPQRAVELAKRRLQR